MFRWVNKLNIVGCYKQLISNRVGFEPKAYLTIAILFATVGFLLSSPSSYFLGPSFPSNGIDKISSNCVYSGLNAGRPPAPEQRVRFLLGPMEGSKEKELTLTATSVPTLTDHLLGKVHFRQGSGRHFPGSLCPDSLSQSVLRLLSQTFEGPQ